MLHMKRESVFVQREWGASWPAPAWPLFTPSLSFRPPPMSLLLNMCAAVSCRVFVWTYGVCAFIQYMCLDKEHFYIFQLGILSGERALGEIFTTIIPNFTGYTEESAFERNFNQCCKREQTIISLRATCLSSYLSFVTFPWRCYSHGCRFPSWAARFCSRCFHSSEVRFRSSLFISLRWSLWCL